MSVNSYEEFLSNPLKLDERLPTIEEVLLATGHFFSKTNDELFNTIKKKIEDAKDGKRNLDWNDIPVFFSCFDFGDLDPREVWWTYKTAIEEHSTRYAYKNEFICFIMMNVFLKRWHLENASHWFSNLPEKEKPFSDYLTSEIAPKLQNTNDKIRDKYRKWLKNQSTPSIDSFIEFWDSIKDLFKDAVIPQKEILFAYWFWQKFREDFEVEDKINYNSLKETQKSINDLIDILKNKKKLDSIEKAETILHKLRKESFSGTYPIVLYLEIRHLVYQTKYTEIPSRLECLSKCFFTLPYPFQREFYESTMACVAHLHQSESIDKNTKKKLISIFKDLYEKGIYYGLMDSTSLSKDPKENIIANIRKWARQFDQRFPREQFYGMQYKIDYSISFPKPNAKKADSYYINFGECINSPQISFFSRINDLDSVNKLLKNKTIQVTKVGIQNDSALFWSVLNMSLMNHYAFFLQTVFPPTPKYLKNMEVLKLSAPYYEKIFNIRKYKESFAQQIDTAREIFYKLVSRCKDSSLRNKSLDDFEKGFSITKVGNESLLQNAIYSARYDIVENTIALYKHFVPNSTKVQKWINEKAGFPPVPAIYHAVRIYSQKQHVDLHLEEPLFRYNRPVDNDVNANYQQILYSTVASSVPQKIQEIEQQKAIAQNSGILKLTARNHFVIINEFVHEEECLKILRLLLDNGADPLIEINMAYEDNGPSSYNALKFAIEIGWLKGVEIMCEYIKRTSPITQNMLDEWLKVGIGWEDQWLRLWKNAPYSEKYAKKCHEVVTYLQTLNTTQTSSFSS